MCTSRRLNKSRMHINVHFACKELRKNFCDLFLLFFVLFLFVKKYTNVCAACRFLEMHSVHYLQIKCREDKKEGGGVEGGGERSGGKVRREVEGRGKGVVHCWCGLVVYVLCKA